MRQQDDPSLPWTARVAGSAPPSVAWTESIQGDTAYYWQLRTEEDFKVRLIMVKVKLWYHENNLISLGGLQESFLNILVQIPRSKRWKQSWMKVDSEEDRGIVEKKALVGKGISVMEPVGIRVSGEWLFIWRVWRIPWTAFLQPSAVPLETGWPGTGVNPASAMQLG